MPSTKIQSYDLDGNILEGVAQESTSQSILTNINTNNTGSKTGTLSQKESYIISQLENSTYGLSALKTAVQNSGSGDSNHVSLTGEGTTLYSSTSGTSVTGRTGRLILAKFQAPVDGVYKITARNHLSKGGSSSSYGYNLYVHTIDGETDYGASFWNTYNSNSVGTKLSDYSKGTVIGSVKSPTTGIDSFDFYVNLRAGAPVLVYGAHADSSPEYAIGASATVTYQAR